MIEQRGNGYSPYRAGDGSHFSLMDYVAVDVPTVCDWIDDNMPNMPRYIGGHSLGGHVASLYVSQNLEKFEGIIHFTCGIPYPADFSFPGNIIIRLFASLVPVTEKFLGYFPGKSLGFAGREYTGLMQDWRLWTKQGHYNTSGFEGVEDEMAKYSGRVLSIAIEKDNLMTHAAIERACRPFKSADVTRLTLGAAEQGDYLGHINWARKPNGAVSAVCRWVSDI